VIWQKTKLNKKSPVVTAHNHDYK